MPIALLAGAARVGENEDERFHMPFIIYLNSTAYSAIIV